MFPRHLSPGKTPQILGGLSKTSFPGTSLMVHSVRNKNYYLLNKKNCRYLWPFWTENTFWPNFCYFFRALRWFKKAKINIKYSLTILEFLVVLVLCIISMIIYHQGKEFTVNVTMFLFSRIRAFRVLEPIEYHSLD